MSVLGQIYGICAHKPDKSVSLASATTRYTVFVHINQTNPFHQLHEATTSSVVGGKSDYFWHSEEPTRLLTESFMYCIMLKHY